MKPEKYLHIRAWGRLLGSYEYFIKAEQIQASREKAPRTAIYKSADGKWVTFREIVSKDSKERVRRFVDEMERVFV